MILQGPEIPWCSFWMVVDMPVGVQETGVWFRQCQTAETGLTVQTVQKTRDSMVQFWEGVDTPVGVQTTGLWFRQSEHWILREMTLFMGAMLGSTVIHILR